MEECVKKTFLALGGLLALSVCNCVKRLNSVPLEKIRKVLMERLGFLSPND